MARHATNPVPHISRTSPQLLRVPEAAKILGVSDRTIWSLLDAGDLRRVRLGRRATRISLSDLNAFVERRTEKGGF